MYKLMCLCCAGGLGTLSRYGLAELMKHLAPEALMPWGTWAANIVGCFFFGLVWVLAEERGAVSDSFRLYALVGFMGAFTTFSAYAFESVSLLRVAGSAAGLFNIAGQNLLGIAALAGGMALARAWAG